MAMSQEKQKTLLAVLAIVATIVAVALVWSSLVRTRGNVETDIKTTVLCANPDCGYYGETSLSQLEDKGGTDAASPESTGFKCPKCGQYALRANPLMCTKCKKPYLMRIGPTGAYDRTCPRCKTEN
ncbi:MAG: hypothetical protein KA354_08635 [Phycisphaerae bacterium]|nr:hypothetical protein [Phycisphaerae bacterium]